MNLKQKKELGYASMSFKHFKRYFYEHNDLIGTTRGGNSLNYVLNIIHSIYFGDMSKENYIVATNKKETKDLLLDTINLTPSHLKPHEVVRVSDVSVEFDNGVVLKF